MFCSLYQTTFSFFIQFVRWYLSLLKLRTLYSKQLFQLLCQPKWNLPFFLSVTFVWIKTDHNFIPEYTENSHPLFVQKFIPLIKSRLGKSRTAATTLSVSALSLMSSHAEPPWTPSTASTATTTTYLITTNNTMATMAGITITTPTFRPFMANLPLPVRKVARHP